MIKKFFEDEKGNVLVESAIAIPIILGLFMGFIFFANAYRYKIVMSQAAKEGARMYQLSMGDIQETEKYANKELSIGRVSAKVSINGGKVTVEKPLAIKIPLFGGHLIKLKSEHEFKEELEKRHYNTGWNP